MHQIIDNQTSTFQIERNHSIIGSAQGSFGKNESSHTIHFYQNVDIKYGDWLINSITSQRYYAKDIHPTVVGQELVHLAVLYETEEDHNLSAAASSTINIHSVNGNSVIGNQQTVVFNIGSNLSDIEKLISNFSQEEQLEAEELLSMLKSIEAATHPVLNAGFLARFSDLLKKHTDLIAAIGGWAVQLLIRN